ncbi:MAG: hypothetical protein MI755_16580 [Sphingomonadales bacterium]|nr:hypothetical protein [Sphingomonadales bacterium]
MNGKRSGGRGPAGLPGPAEIGESFINPLTTIIGFSELLRDEEADLGVAERLAYADLIAESGKHLFFVINALASRTRSQAERRGAHDEPVSLGDLVRQIAEHLMPVTALRCQLLEADFGAGDLVVVGDRYRLKHGLINLFWSLFAWSGSDAVIAIRSSTSPSQPGRLLVEARTSEDAAETEPWPFAAADRPVDWDRIFPVASRVLRHHGATLSVEDSAPAAVRIGILFPDDRILAPKSRAPAA